MVIAPAALYLGGIFAVREEHQGLEGAVWLSLWLRISPSEPVSPYTGPSRHAECIP